MPPGPSRSPPAAYDSAMDVVYLDNNATTMPAPEAVEAMLPYLTQWYGNPSSVHRFGQRARQAIDEARGRLAALIGSGEAEVLFTGGGTEAVNLAVRSLYSTRAPRRRIVTSTVEHSATRELVRQMALEGAEVVEVAVDQAGLLDMEQLARVIDDQTALVTLMWANNETGVLFPVAEIAQLCRAARVPFHCDATQAVGKLPVDVKALGVDAMTFAPHKFHGVKGIGALYVRRGLRLRPLVIGGPQERGRRGGTENVAAIVAAGVAAELAQRHLDQMDRVAAMRDRLEGQILRTIPDTAVNGSIEHRLPNTTNIAFDRLEADAIVIALSERGVCVSAGAACASGSLEPSHVLKAMGIDMRLAHGAIRFSLSRYTTEADLHRCMEVLPPVIERLRAVMPV